jgi:NAD(P)H-dependent flavin oxidoreductase YrpB (nitropropane dioxygenase family)
MATLKTELTEFLGIKYPIILAGMNQAAGPELAAAVTNAGGLGVIGGVGYTPDFMRKQIQELKSSLTNKKAPFGVDLLLPKVGSGARKTNYDYTEGTLPELVDIIIEEGAKLFVCAVGIPPQWAVDKFHKAGILVMNMVGAPKHVKKALAVGVDLICAQGGEGGGHTGDVPTSVLIPVCVDICKDQKSPLTGKPVYVVAAGGIYEGRSLAMALCFGAQAVWVGTRFVAAKEAGAPPRHQQGIVKSGFHDTVRTLIFTGRPLRVLYNDYIRDWEENRSQEIKQLCAKGVIPVKHDLETKLGQKEDVSPNVVSASRPLLSGSCAGAITDIKPASQIIDEMVKGAIEALTQANGLISRL